MMEYKGYLANVTLDEEAGVLFGRVSNTRDVITFEGRSVEEVKREFHASVDDYVEYCRARGEEPERPFSGKFLVRMEPEEHRTIASASARAGQSLNGWVVSQLMAAADRQRMPTTPAHVHYNLNVQLSSADQGTAEASARGLPQGSFVDAAWLQFPSENLFKKPLAQPSRS